MDLLLGALPGCAGVDLVAILKKMRMRLESLRITTNAERAPDHPRVYRRIHLDIDLETDPTDVRRIRRAVELSFGKYCSVSTMLAASASVTYAVRYAGQILEGRVDGPTTE
jgi:putative redox protein